MNPIANTLRALAALILVSTLVCAVDFGRVADADGRSGGQITKSQRIDVCLIAPDAGCKLAGSAAQAKTKTASAPFEFLRCPRSPESEQDASRATPPADRDAVAPHLAATMVLRV